MNIKKLFLNDYAFPIYLAAWLVLNFYYSNITAITAWPELLIIFTVLAMILIIGLKIISIVFKIQISQAVSILFVSTVFAFSYTYFGDHWAQFVLHVFGIIIHKGWYAFCIAFIVLLVIAWKTSKYTYKVFKLVICINLLFVCFNIAKFHTLHTNNRSVNTAFSDMEKYIFKKKPDIYFFLLDAYTRSDLLKQITGFSNDHFITSLEKRNFIVIQNAFSNYNWTVGSLESMFNMQLLNGVLAKRDYQQQRESRRGNHLVRKVLKNNKYTIIKVESRWYELGCEGYEDICIKLDLSVGIYTAFLNNSVLRPIIDRTNGQFFGLKQLKEAIFIPNAPKFVFAQFGDVHDAIYDSHGNFERIRGDNLTTPEEIKDYVNSVKKLNSTLLETIDIIKQSNPNSIIILQADHGSGNMMDLPQGIRNHACMQGSHGFNIFSAIFLPNGINKQKTINHFKYNHSPVNLFRVIFANLSDVPTKLEPNISFCGDVIIDRKKFKTVIPN